MCIEVSKLFGNIPEREGEFLKVTASAAFRAGKIIRRGYNEIQGIQEKGLGDLVSQIDVECDALIQKEIRRVFPRDVILSEELSPQLSSGEERFWIIDPLDGTSAFLFRSCEDMPAVMIGLREQGETLLSVIYFPLTNELFWAVRGYGAYKFYDRLKCTEWKLHESWVEMNQYSDVEFESEIFKKLRRNLRSLGGPRLVTSSPPHSGTGVRIAEGRKKIAAVIHDNGSEKIKQAVWDVIPVALILEESGGVAVNFHDEPYDPFRPEPFIMASSRELAREIMRASLL